MSEQSSTRKATVVDTGVYVQGQDCNRWAVIVGISKYKNVALNLKYADRDAERLYQLLLTPHGGHFQKEYVCKLTNKEATKGNVTRALRSFLKKPAREDLVIIYFACHGSPDPDRPGNVYLLTHDCDPQDIAGTALPMDDINRALKDTLLSEKVIIFADTCHSAAIGGGIRSRAVTENTQLINRYLQHISQARKGTALLTSAEANEVSFEDKKWGGGHGVFTYYLLRGLRGEADANNNGFVAVGELFEYVRENVKNATNHRQHPSIGTNPFDRNMPLAIAASNTEENLSELPSEASGLMGNLPGSVLPGWSGERGRPAFSKHYIMVIALAALLFGGGALFLGQRENLPAVTKPTDPDVPNPPDDTEYRAKRADMSEQALKEAAVLEKKATAQFQQLSESGFTEEGLEAIALIWDDAKTKLEGINSEDAGYPKAEKALMSYERQWQYTTARRLGLIAANRSALRDTNTSEEWDDIIRLREEAIALLSEIPITETELYSDARQKIAEYESAIGGNTEYRLVSRYLYARRQGDFAETERVKAERATPQSAADWYAVAGYWGNAVEQMRKVTPEDRRYKESQQKIVEYTANRDYARKRGDFLDEVESMRGQELGDAG